MPFLVIVYLIPQASSRSKRRKSNPIISVVLPNKASILASNNPI